MPKPAVPTYEEILAFVLAQLTPPVEQQADDDGGVVITSGEPGEVIVRLTDSEVTVAEHAVRWENPYTPVVEPVHIGTVSWEAISTKAATRTLKALIAGARESRLSKFRVCRFCGTSTAPEWLHSDDVCQACAEREMGVVH